VAWNRVNTGHRAAQGSALDWSLVAMGEATERLQQLRSTDLSRGLGAITEAVWWVTLVDATLVRYHPGAYDQVLACQEPAGRQALEDTLGGLRFVRNKMGYDRDPGDFAGPPASPPASAEVVSAWLWLPVPGPVCGSPPERGQQWELARHQSYRAQLDGQCVGDTFSRAASFLRLAATSAGIPAGSAASARA
jgi:hypothetical protein